MKLLHSFVALFICISCIYAQDKASLNRFEKLKQLQRKSKVLDFTDDSLQTYTTQPSHYSIVLLFATTNNQIPGADIAVQASREFANVAEAYFQSLGSNGLDSAAFQERPIFFARCELEKCREAFRDGSTKAGWRVIPKLMIIPPRSTKGSLDLAGWIDMTPEPVFANSAEMGQWISQVTGYPLVVHTPFFETHGNTIVTVILIAIALYAIKPTMKAWAKQTLFWYAVSLGVYAFSMAGVVFNAIHNPPWYYVHPQNKQVMYIYPSARQQFVAEGIIMACLLTGIALVFVGFGTWVPKIKDIMRKRLVFAALSFLFFGLYQQIFKIFRSKYGWYPF